MNKKNLGPHGFLGESSYLSERAVDFAFEKKKLCPFRQKPLMLKAESPASIDKGCCLAATAVLLHRSEHEVALYGLVDAIDFVDHKVHHLYVGVAHIFMNHLVIYIAARCHPAVFLLAVAEHTGGMLVVGVEQTLLHKEVVLKPSVVAELALQLPTVLVEGHHGACLLVLRCVTILCEVDALCQTWCQSPLRLW